MKFDLSKSCVQNLIKLNESYMQDNVPFKVPVQVEKNNWQQVSGKHQFDALKKEYQFKNAKHMLYFLSEILKETFDYENVPYIEINNDVISLEIKAVDLGTITKLEVNLSKYIDEIYEDIRYL